MAGTQIKFNYSEDRIPDLPECDKINKVLWKMVLGHESLSTVTSKKVSRCFVLDKEFNAYINFKSSDKKLEYFLDYMKVSKTRKHEILKIYEAVKQKRQTYEYQYKSFINLDISGKKQIAFYYIKKYKDLKLNIKDQEHPLFLLSQSYFLLRLNNIGGAKKSLNKFLQISPLEYQVKLEGMAKVKKFNIDQFNKKIIDLVEYIDNKISNSIYSKLITHYLKMIDPNLKDIVNLEEKYNVNWSLVDIRKMAHSIEFGIPFLSLWVFILEQRSSESEIEELLKYWANSKEIKFISNKTLWIYAYFNHYGNVGKKNISKLIYPISKGPNEVWEYYLSFWTSQKEWSENFKSYSANYKKPLFSKKRKSLIRILNRFGASNFSIFELLKLGDESDDYFWWYVL